MTTNHGLYTDCAWAVPVLFSDPAGAAVDLSGSEYVAEMIANGAVVFTFKSTGAGAGDGDIDTALAADGTLTFSVTKTQSETISAGFYRLHLKRVSDVWTAEGTVIIGDRGANETYMRFDDPGAEAAGALSFALRAELAEHGAEVARDDAEAASAEAAVQAGTATTQAGVSTTQAASSSASAAASLAAKVAAELARDSAFTNANVYSSTSVGLAAVSDGVQFQVVSGDIIIRYRRDAGPVATEVARYPSADAIGSTTRFETLELDLTDSIYLLDPSDKLIQIIPDPNSELIIQTAPTAFSFETLDTECLVRLVDVNGYLVAPESPAVMVGPEAGTARNLSTRLSRGLSSYGDLLLPTYMEWKLRNVRFRLRRLKQGNGGQLALAFCGDSWVQGDTYWLRQFSKQLHDTYGFAGLGWVGFQYFGTATGTWVDGGSQPSGGGAGCSRGDLSIPPVFSGTWTSDNGAGGLASPSIGDAASTQAGAYVRFAFPSGHTSADLYYAGDGTGVVKYSWDGGSTWSANISLTGVGPSYVALASVPSGSGTLRIAVVSGTVRLTGVNMKSTANGIVVHKLGASGSNTSQWAAVSLSTWADQLASLGAHCVAVLLGTNDASSSVLPQIVANNAANVMSALASKSAAFDRLWIMPPDRSGTATLSRMDQYAAAVRQSAVDGAFSFLDLQYAFGANPADYALGGVIPLLDGSGAHPTPETGGALIADAVHRLISPVI